MSSHRILPIAELHIFIGAIPQVRHLTGAESRQRKQQKDTERRRCSQKGDIPHTSSSMYFLL